MIYTLIKLKERLLLNVEKSLLMLCVYVYVYIKKFVAKASMGKFFKQILIILKYFFYALIFILLFFQLHTAALCQTCEYILMGDLLRLDVALDQTLHLFEKIVEDPNNKLANMSKLNGMVYRSELLHVELLTKYNHLITEIDNPNAYGNCNMVEEQPKAREFLDSVIRPKINKFSELLQELYKKKCLIVAEKRYFKH